MKGLYDLSDDNRRFLHARLLENLADSNLEDARRKVGRLINTSTVFNNRFRHGDVKRVVDQYARATGDDAGVARLLLADLEASLETISQVGDYEPIVDHAYASMERLHKTLERLAGDAARPLLEELARVAAPRFSDQFGWGLSDELDGLAAEWEERLA